MAFGSRENHHSSNRAVHPVIAGHVLCEGVVHKPDSKSKGLLPMQLVPRTKSAYNLWCLSSVSKPRASGLGQSPAPIVDPFTMVRCPSFFQPRMRASWVWQRRSRVDGKDIRQVAQTEWIFLRQLSSHVSSIQSYQLCFGGTFLLSLRSIPRFGL